VTFALSAWCRRYCEPPAAIGSIRPKMRSRISGQRTPVSCSSTPYRELIEGVLARSAVCTNILVGMQPTFRQVPPKVPRSTIAVFQSANRPSRIEFPEPVPTITKS
jgi:hypothetical protein